MGSTSLGVSSHPKLRKIRYHFPANETTHRDNKGKGPVYGSRHGKNSWNFHSKENVDLIKSDYTNHWHRENIAELDGFPTSAGSNSWSNCRSLCTEKTNHQSSQPIKTKAQGMTTYRDKEIFGTSLFLRDEVTFCSWGRCWRRMSASRLEWSST